LGDSAAQAPGDRVLAAVIGPEYLLIDEAADLIRTPKATLYAWRGQGIGTVRLLATDGPERFARVGSVFSGEPIAAGEVELVDL